MGTEDVILAAWVIAVPQHKNAVCASIKQVDTSINIKFHINPPIHFHAKRPYLHMFDIVD